MKSLLLFTSLIITVLARPSVNLKNKDGYVSVTQSTDGTYKYLVLLKNSSKFEQKFKDGSVIGEYTAPNARVRFQQYRYTSVPGGYRTVKPKPATVPAVAPYAPARVVVQYSPEVLAAREQFLALFHKTLARRSF